MQSRIATIGFGEAAQAFATGWARPSGQVSACDIRAADPAMQAAAGALGAMCHLTPDPALTGADLVFCLVPADQSLIATQAAAPFLATGALWCDGTSSAPGTKRASAAIITAAGGRYVDMAIMAPVHPKLHRTPALISGPYAAEALDILGALRMQAQIAGETVGEASAIKMMRSVMIKGIEALTAECLLAARKAGVEQAVLASLQASNPEWNWADKGAYHLERMMVHGTRRAAEMREVCLTLRELGLPDRMALAITDWQADIGALHLPGGADDLADRADRILGRL